MLKRNRQATYGYTCICMNLFILYYIIIIEAKYIALQYYMITLRKDLRSSNCCKERKLSVKQRH